MSILVILITLIIISPSKVYANATNDLYNDAVVIDDEQSFKDVLQKENTVIITDSKITSNESITYEYSDEEYLAVYKVKEIYKKHTTHTVTMAGKTAIPITSTHYSWDYDSKTSNIVNTINIMGESFDTSLFKMPTQKIETYYYDKTDENIRYYYEVTPKNFNAAFIAKVTNEGLAPVNNKQITLQKDMSRQELQKLGKSYINWKLIFGGFFIIIFIIILICAFKQ